MIFLRPVVTKKSQTASRNNRYTDFAVRLQFSLSSRLEKPRTVEKKTDVSKHPQVFQHVGLLINAPTGLL
jgi:hypothetical protein